jgi:hypothetical protein
MLTVAMSRKGFEKYAHLGMWTENGEIVVIVFGHDEQYKFGVLALVLLVDYIFRLAGSRRLSTSLSCRQPPPLDVLAWAPPLPRRLLEQAARRAGCPEPLLAGSLP